MSNYEEIQIKLDLVLDEKRQKDLDLIHEYFKAADINSGKPFINYTREKALTSALEVGIFHYISDKADYFRLLSELKGEETWLLRDI